MIDDIDELLRERAFQDFVRDSGINRAELALLLADPVIEAPEGFLEDVLARVAEELDEAA
jgi:hypothetical protein